MPPKVSEDDVSVDVRSDLSSTSLAAAVEVENRSAYDFESTVVRLIFREVEAGGEYERELDFGSLETGESSGVLFSSTQQAQPPLCYDYELQVRLREEESYTFEGGVCE